MKKETMSDYMNQRYLPAVPEKINELFQMERAELVFGIYRIMNMKRAVISRYFNEYLFSQEEEILSADLLV